MVYGKAPCREMYTKKAKISVSGGDGILMFTVTYIWTKIHSVFVLDFAILNARILRSVNREHRDIIWHLTASRHDGIGPT